MPTNPPIGDNARKRAMGKRFQALNPVVKQLVKRDTDTGRFLDVTQDDKPFKGVRKERKRRPS